MRYLNPRKRNLVVKIIHNVFCGDEEDGISALKKGDFSVASMCKECPVGHRATVGYKTLAAPKEEDYYFIKRGRHFAANLIDVDDVNYIPEGVINPALEFIRTEYAKGNKILIHCEHGHSRGPTTTLMFLRTINEMPYSFKVSKKIFKSLYPKYDPAKGIDTYARNHWEELGNVDKHE